MTRSTAKTRRSRGGITTTTTSAFVVVALAVLSAVSEVAHAQQHDQGNAADADAAVQPQQHPTTTTTTTAGSPSGGGGSPKNNNNKASSLSRKARRAARLARLGQEPEPEAHLGALPVLALSAEDKFPKSFVFGVSASSFQIEGDGGDRPRSVWDDFADQNEIGDEARAGIRHYEHYAGDVKYMADAGVQHYRLSLSWPRLMNADLTPNEEGYAFYKSLLAEMKTNGIVPYVTLFHWDLPSFLCERTSSAEDASLGAVDATAKDAGYGCAGAWLDPGIVATFETYAAQAFERLGSSVHFWATLNEPKTIVNLGYGTGAHAPGIQSSTAPLVAAHNMLLAHAAAAKVYREKFQKTQGGAVTLVVNCDWREPQNPDSPEDVEGAKRAMEEEMGWFADPLYNGDYPASMRDRLGDTLPRFTPEQSASLKGSTDYFALNHYSSRYVKHADSLSPGNSYLGRPVDWLETEKALDGTPIGPDASSVWLKQVPWGMRKTLLYVKERYGNPPTYVTENGVSVNPPEGATLEQQLDDVERVNFMNQYLSQVLAAVKEGADVRGYFHWSFFDNFEWSEGTETRFGLVHVDFKGEFGGEWMRRRAKSSLKVYREYMTGEHSEGGGGGGVSDGAAAAGAASLGGTATAMTTAAAGGEGGEGGEGMGSLYVYPLAALGDGVVDDVDDAAEAEAAAGVRQRAESAQDSRDVYRNEVRKRAVAALGRPSSVIGLDGRVINNGGGGGGSSPTRGDAGAASLVELHEIFTPQKKKTDVVVVETESALAAAAAADEDKQHATMLDSLAAEALAGLQLSSAAAASPAAATATAMKSKEPRLGRKGAEGKLSASARHAAKSSSKRSKVGASSGKKEDDESGEEIAGDSTTAVKHPLPADNNNITAAEEEKKLPVEEEGAGKEIGAATEGGAVKSKTKGAKASKESAAAAAAAAAAAGVARKGRGGRSAAHGGARISGGDGGALSSMRGEIGEVGMGWGPLAMKTWWVSWGPAAAAAAAGVMAGVLLIAVQVSCTALVKKRDSRHTAMMGMGAAAHNGGGGGGGGGAGGAGGAVEKRWNRPESRTLITKGTTPSYGV